MAIETGGQKLTSLFNQLKSTGIVDLIVPFLFFFTLIFALLQKTKIFREKGKDTADKKISGIIAFSISLLISAAHVTNKFPPESNPVLIVGKFAANTSILLIVLVLVLIVLGLTGSGTRNTVKYVAALFAIGILSYTFYNAVMPSQTLLGKLFSDPVTQVLVIILVIAAFVIMYVTNAGGQTKTLPQKLKALFEET